MVKSFVLSFKSSEDSNVGMNYKVITFSPKETPF